MSAIACPSQETLVALLDGTIEQVNPIEHHIRECAECQTRLDALSGSTVLAEARPNATDKQARFAFLTAARRPDDLGSIEQLCIVREIGRGGMGIVFLAFDQALNREVAVKVLSADPSKQSDARFEREARAAAGLQHDHLVTVHSIGRTPDNRPYLVMPLVNGHSLKDRLTKNAMEPKEAATVVMGVANGLAAVHKAGLIHRDVKPANVLIDELDGRAKLTDFGLARRDMDATLTQANAVCGTPHYISPEQALDASTAGPSGDIYSLGITLYECLTGITPFRGAPIQILRQHRESEPVRPTRINVDVPRDLETICLKAIAKEPHRRYASAADFSDDLGRFLEGRPIHAKPTTALTSLWLWSKRNRALATSLALLLLALVTGTTVSTALWLRSERNAAAERAASESAERRLAQIEKGNAILGSIFADLDIQSVRHNGESLESALAKRLVAAANELDSESIGEPLAEAEIQQQLGTSLSNLGHPQEGIELLEKSLATRKEVLGTTNLETLQSMAALASAYQDDHQIANAKQLCIDALAISESLHGADALETATATFNLAVIYHEDGDFELARPLFERSLEVHKKLLGVNDPATLKALDGLAEHLDDTGNPADALPLFEQALQGNIESAGENHPRTAMAMNNLAFCHKRLGNIDQAISLFEQALATFKAKLAFDHPDVLMCTENLAYAHLVAGNYDRAIPMFEQMVDLNKTKLGPDHFQTLVSMDGLASGYRLAGRPEEAVTIWEEVLAVRKQTLGENHPVTLTATNNLATGYYSIGNLELAAAMFDQVYQGTVARRGADNIDVTHSASNLAAVYFKLGQFEKALPLYEHALGIRRDALGDEHPETLLSMTSLANNYRDLKRLDEALELYGAALPKLHANLGEDHPQSLNTSINLAIAQKSAGNLDEAVEILTITQRQALDKLGEAHPLYTTAKELLDEYERALAP